MDASAAFDSDRAFRAFVAASSEKAISAAVLEAFLGEAFTRSVILGGDAPVELYVPGIGEGTQALNVAGWLNGLTGRPVHVTAADQSPDFVAATRARLLSAPFIGRVAIETRDIFAPGGITASGIDVTIPSQILYYVPDRAAVARFVGGIAGCLAPQGIACFVHGTPQSRIVELRETYRSLLLPSPVAAIAQAAAGLGLPVFTIDYASALFFPDPALLSRLRQPENCAADAALSETAALVEFVLRRSLPVMKAAGTLDAALTDLQAKLSDGNTLRIHSQVQVIPAPALAATPARVAALGESAARTAAQVPEIERRLWRARGV